jgi:hypothetical protein
VGRFSLPLSGHEQIRLEAQAEQDAAAEAHSFAGGRRNSPGNRRRERDPDVSVQRPVSQRCPGKVEPRGLADPGVAGGVSFAGRSNANAVTFSIAIT